MDDLTPNTEAFDNWATSLVPPAITHWHTADGKRVPVEKIGANHALNIVLFLASRELLDMFAHKPLIDKAKSWRVFGPWAALTRWHYDRKRRKLVQKRMDEIKREITAALDATFIGQHGTDHSDGK